MYRKIIKQITPAFLLDALKYFFTPKPTAIWAGNYSSWEEVQKYCTGYDGELILERCKNSLLKIKDGEAVYERDTVLFDEIQYSTALLAGLQKAALENSGNLCVLDFGGSLGSSYYQNRSFLGSLNNLEWCIVEQPHFVDCGKKTFENEELKFYYTIEECLKEKKPNVILLSSVLQYLDNPEQIIDNVLDTGAPYIVLDRLALSNESRNILTIQSVDKSFYEAKLGHWFFSYDKILSKFSDSYDLLLSARSFADAPIVLDKQTPCYFNILIFRKNEMSTL